MEFSKSRFGVSDDFPFLAKKKGVIFKATCDIWGSDNGRRMMYFPTK